MFALLKPYLHSSYRLIQITAAGSSPSSVADAGQKRRAHGAKSPKPNLKVQHPNQDHDHLHNPTSPCEVHHITRTLRHKGKDVGVSIATDKEKQIKGPPQKAPSKHPSPMINDNASNRIYFCTKCYRPYKNSDDCKKHEKEYEDIYVCRALEQDDAVCVAADQTPTMFKRRYDMVAHLRTHNIHQDGAAIADQWKVCSSKNAYACGFCIHYFPTLKDRLRHIHDEHFKRRRQTMRDWDNDKVILGLLDQPGVKDCWEFKKSTMPFLLARFHWGKAAVEKLLGLLEEGPNGVVSAMTLAQAAYDDLEWEFGDDGINPPTYQTDGQEHATPVAQLEPPSPSNVKLEDPDPIRSSRMTKQASHASHSSKWPSIPDPWNYMPDGLSNGYMSPQPAFASPFLSSKQATPYTDGRSTHYSGPSFRTPRTGSTINPNSAMMRYQLPQNEENVKRSVEQPQDIDFGEGTMEYYTMGAIGESPTMPHERLHEPPSPSKSPSVTQRIKKACRKKSKSGICGGKG